MRRQLLTALRVSVALLIVCAAIYPLAVWMIGRVAFAHGTDGSLLTADGRIIGSELIGQRWTGSDGEALPRYFQPRPSAAGGGYDPGASGGSNLGPANPRLLDSVAERAAAYRKLNGLAPDARVPVDAVTASGSGLDPHISIANALAQAPRVARVRHLPEATVVALVRDNTSDRAFKVLGEKAVNVLMLNLALDAQAR